MSNTESPAEPVHVYMDKDLRQRLREQARAEDRTQRAVLERALRRELQGETNRRPA